MPELINSWMPVVVIVFLCLALLVATSKGDW
jgi:hypothetical protein